MNREYAHYKNYPKNKWPWENFTPKEMRSKSDNKLMIDPPSMDCLQTLRDIWGRAISITSAYRSPAHNAKVGGAKGSKHLDAKAYDMPVADGDWAEFEAAARAAGFTGFGFYKDSKFMHCDTGPAREWFGTGASSRWWSTVPAKPAQQPTAGKKGGLAVIIAAIIAVVYAGRDWIVSLFGG